MKLQRFFLISFFAIGILSSCSNDPADQESGSTNTASSTTTNAATKIEPVAKEKKPDAAVQGIKGKIAAMSETISFPGNPKKALRKNVFKYDENGNRIELSMYRADGKLSSTIKSTYDANGIITGEQTFLGDGKLDVISTIKTDAKGNIIEQNDSRPADNGATSYKYVFKYDEKGQQTERIAYKGSNILSFRYEFTYDENGNRAEWRQYGPANSVVGKVVYKYDASNNLIEEKHFTGFGILKATYVISREFDKKNNWIREKKMENNTVIEIKEREIKYR